MKTFIRTFTLLALLALLQSCIVSSKSNMDFLDRESLGRDAQITSVNPPMFLAKPIIKKSPAG